MRGSDFLVLSNYSRIFQKVTLNWLLGLTLSCLHHVFAIVGTSALHKARLSPYELALLLLFSLFL